MTEYKRAVDCEKYSGQLPAYLDYILQGMQFPGQEEVEEHLALCPVCAWEYTDLLGMVLRNWMEPILDQIMEGEPGPENLDLFIEYNSHWFEICTLLAEKIGAAEALSHLGILYELKGDNEQALHFHLEALEQVVNLENAFYVQMLSASALGRIYRKKGNWEDAFSYLKVSCLAAVRLKDEYALTRNLIETGNYFSRSLSYNRLYWAVSMYNSAVGIAEQVGYVKSREIAKKRIGQLKNELGIFISKLVEKYIKSFYKKEVSSLDKVCGSLAAKLIENMTGFNEANKMHTLFMDQSFSRNTYNNLLTFLDTVLFCSPAVDSLQIGEESFVVPLLSQEVFAGFIKEVQGLGLSPYQSEDLADFLRNALTHELLDKQDIGKEY